MNANINQYMPHALKAVEKYLAKPPAEGKERPDTVSKEYDGYAASFTAAITTSGLLPTLAFYTDIHKSKPAKEAEEVLRYKTTQALMYILHPSESRVAKNALLMHVMEELYGPVVNDPEKLLGAINMSKLPALQKKIMDAAIALKLALRNFIQYEDPKAKSD